MSDSDTSRDNMKKETNFRGLDTSDNKNLKTDSQTDMMFQYFTNNEKLVDPEKRQFFDNNNYNQNNEYQDSTTDHKYTNQNNINGINMSEFQKKYNNKLISKKRTKFPKASLSIKFTPKPNL